MKRLNDEDKIRYSRQMAIEGFGQEGQDKLIKGSVVIIGCGALGSLTAMYLAGAGIGHITIADFDSIDISNLHRQLFFSTSDAGKSKAIVLAEKMRALNPNIKVSVINQFITDKNAVELCCDADVVIDGSDNPDTKYLLENVCKSIRKPFIVAGVSGFRGQIMTIFSDSVCFSDIFPPVSNNGYAPCSIGGIIGPTAGMAASIMASECIKILSGTGTPLTNKVIMIDLKHGNLRSISI